MVVNIIELKSKIVNYIFHYGPVLPVQISKYINSNTLFAGAVLSELISNKKILVSHAKIGGSPVYYVHGQEYKLTMLYKYLNEREREIYDLLNKNRVLKDSLLEPWQRVAIREIKDFAVMLKTKEEEIFWKWYQLPDKEVEPLILEFYKKPEPEKIKKPIEEKKEVKVEEKKEIKPKEIEVKPEIKIKIAKPKEKKQIKEKPIKKLLPIEDLDSRIIEFFNNKNIKVLEKNIIKKNKEIEFTANVPSEVGYIKFYIKFKDKKKISDSDLSIEHNKGQLKKLPLLFLTTGELTKKAKDYINNNYLVFEKI